MSLYDYQISKEIDATDPPFAAIIMAALRKADTDNFALLSRDFPDIHQELAKRYNAPGGFLEGEREAAI